ncbi:Gamma-aminobutyric acid receptor subunit alpha-2 [Desmophyllum pertusum]|uniref:Gamma-aminobutyric acid receptor subunit alpha-2 n=1 Tax=Desmophyllum pertusum TaxID=174260 RepID=A0A9X0D107_9CNID|nr:Gamma-aminobutyric acid receptor subunit alpha-2 [Desmophyllum pertusum]
MEVVYVGDFQEADMSFTLELYFRQYWQDSRLAYKKPNKQITLSGNMADRLWQPDTFFENSKKGELHKLTTLNKVMVVKPDGRVFVSTRITLTCLCAMDFRNFPMDRQVCDLNFFSCNYSVLGVRFVFTRRIGHYLTRVYFPAILIVLMSWLSFFVDRSSVPARVSLGITTVLTMTTLLIGIGQGSLPVVSYVKAVDVYLIVCYTLVFGAFAEYALMNYIETTSNRHKQLGSSHEMQKHTGSFGKNKVVSIQVSRKDTDTTGSDLIAHNSSDMYNEDRSLSSLKILSEISFFPSPT